MVNYDNSHRCTISLNIFQGCLDELPKVPKKHVWNEYILDKHRNTIIDKFILVVDIWSGPCV